MMFTPQLPDRKVLKDVMETNMRNLVAPGFLKDPNNDFGLSGTLYVDGVKGMRRKGTLSWSGMPNEFWVSF